MNKEPEKPKIVLLGVAGRMGQTISERFMLDGKVNLVGACDQLRIGNPALTKPDLSVTPPIIVPSIADLPRDLDADIVLDFSMPEGTRANLGPTMERGWDLIIGTTGHTETALESFRIQAEKHARRIVLVPNFTLGVNLMFKFAKMASKVFDNVEIIEMHHEKKADAPSGTAIYTAKLIRDENPGSQSESKTEGIVKPDDRHTNLDRSRGRFEANIPIHSLRLPGYLAHQEVIFGSEGETLKIRHDTTDRAAFLTGIYFAIENIHKLQPGFHTGLDWAFD